MGAGAGSPGRGYALAMSGEIRDWLAELGASDPPAAATVRQALVALMERGAGLGEPLVASTAAAWPAALVAALDTAYDDRLEQLHELRQRAIGAADLAGELQAEGASADAFRIRKEVLKASYTAAAYGLEVDQAIAAAEGPDDGAPDDGAARARIADLTGQMERELDQEGWPEGLMDLRPGAPEGIGVSILFAVEPAGAALLLAALEGPRAVRDHYHEAILLAAGVLRGVRAGNEPEAAAHVYDDPRALPRDVAGA